MNVTAKVFGVAVEGVWDDTKAVEVPQLVVLTELGDMDLLKLLVS